jgi:hypothetical protein
MAKDYKKTSARSQRPSGKQVAHFAEGGTVKREGLKDWMSNFKANIKNPGNSQFVLPKFGNEPGNSARRSRGQAMATMLFGFLPQRKSPK